MSMMQITVRSLDDSPAVRSYVSKHFEKLQRMYRNMSHCHVVIDLAQNHRHQTKLFSISVDITLQGKEIVCRKRNHNPYVAIRECFSTVKKLLEKYTHKVKRPVLKDKFTLSQQLAREAMLYA